MRRTNNTIYGSWFNRSHLEHERIVRIQTIKHIAFNRDHDRFLEMADKGTLFLDEIGEINLNMQVKLLRALDGDGFTPLGSNMPSKTDIRVIAATNKDLDDYVKNGLIRSDFFYRINVIPIHIPPLRKRKEDIALLIYHFLRKFCTGKTLPHIPPNIMTVLENYDWPAVLSDSKRLVNCVFGTTDLIFTSQYIYSIFVKMTPKSVSYPTNHERLFRFPEVSLN
ncbi:MAG: sigma-54-dependent Fis family transcriptional regulator [Desulfobacteraceae bacterium]|nr:sigma-54-dependent Fis family transcriptional regulator [Desulfobacteraceae bacterium]